MTGTFWIISYVALCFTVLVLTLAIGTLFREVGTRAGRGTSELPTWPFSAAAPGSAVPDLLAESVATALSVAGWPEDLTGFCVFASDDEDAYSAVMATAAVAEHWERPIAVVLERRGGSDWIDLLPSELRERIAFVSQAPFEQLGIRGTPITSYLRRGLIAEAVAGTLSPSQIEKHFKLAAAPLFSLSPR